MKRLIHFTATFLFCLSLSSCLSLMDPNTEPLNKETIAARWEVNDPSSEFSLFEFDKNGNYIVLSSVTLKSTNAMKSHIGEYTIVNSNTIELEEFGTIVFQTFNSKNAKFTITLKDATTGKVVEVVAAEKISETTKTQMLCKIWQHEAYPANDLLYGYTFKLLFSNSGTYFASIEDPEKNYLGAVNFWCWKDSLETTICISDVNDDICSKNTKFEIIELTNTRLKLKEPGSDFIETYMAVSSLR